MSVQIETDKQFADLPEITVIPRSRAGRLDVSKTKSYRETLVFEQKLQSFLQEFVTVIIKTETDITQIRTKFHKPVSDMFRGTLQNVYAIGANYTNHTHNTIPYLSDNDNAQIKKITEYGTGQFFHKIETYLKREVDIEQSDFFWSIEDRITRIFKEMNQDTTTNLVIQPKKVNLKPLSIDKQIDNLITSVVFMTLNVAVIQKTRQLESLANADQTVALAGDADLLHMFAPILQNQYLENPLINAGVVTLATLPFLGGLKRLIKKIRPSKYLMWVTEMDDKVCFKYCQPLDGKQFDPSSNSHPIPIISTHPNCRCRLFSMDSNGNLLADVTFADWEG